MQVARSGSHHHAPQPECNTASPLTPSVEHCGGVSIWDVASGGRMGFVTGEDAVELANSPTDCVQNCQAQNRSTAGWPSSASRSPVPDGSRRSRHRDREVACIDG